MVKLTLNIEATAMSELNLIFDITPNTQNIKILGIYPNCNEGA